MSGGSGGGGISYTFHGGEMDVSGIGGGGCHGEYDETSSMIPSPLDEGEGTVTATCAGVARKCYEKLRDSSANDNKK